MKGDEGKGVTSESEAKKKKLSSTRSSALAGVPNYRGTGSNGGDGALAARRQNRLAFSPKSGKRGKA